mgnify:CR=1 FL=1
MTKTIRPLPHLDAVVTLPGSKSYTQRALVIASLAEGQSVLNHPLFAEDTHWLMEALRALGAQITIRNDAIIVTGTGGRLRTPDHPLHLGNNGTALRLLTTAAALGKGAITLTGDPRLCERPIRPLLDALRTLGVDCRGRNDTGFPPVAIHAEGLHGGRVVLQDIESSQYVSSLLISAPYARGDVEVLLSGRIPSLPYIGMTLEAMTHFGQTVESPALHHYRIRGGRRYEGRAYRVEGDASSASYFFLAAALLKGRIRVENVNPATLQGDIGMVALLEDLGCMVRRGDDWLEVTGRDLKSGDCRFDLGDMPDMVPTLAVLSALRPGRTVIGNVAHLRHKESNRLAALVAELNRAGIEAKETEDGIMIHGGIPRGAVIETYNDHRIAMSFAILGLAVPGMEIQNSACVNKSFPEFWDTLDRLYS